MINIRKYPELLDEEDKELLTQFTWAISDKGYWYSTKYNPVDQKQTKVYLHILVLERKSGPRPHKHLADHENRNRLDNRRLNLRWVTYSINNSNRKKKEDCTPRWKQRRDEPNYH